MKNLNPFRNYYNNSNYIPYGRQNITRGDIRAVVEVLKSEFLTQGNLLKDFEKGISEKVNSKYAIAVNSATSALHIACLALGLKKGDYLWTSPITFVASANCVESTGAKVEFVDINRYNFTIDIPSLEKKLKSNKKIKGIIAVDYAGHPCDWKSLRKLANKYKVTLINDNCHAMGSKYFQDSKYAIKYADVVTHSYHAVKSITSGEGGSILTNQKKLHKKFLNIRSHSMNKNSKKASWFYSINEVGFNYRLSDIQCALGISQLKKLDRFIYKRRKIAELYRKLLKNDKRFILPYEDKNVYHSYHLFPLQINFNFSKITKKSLFNKMMKSGFRLQVHYIPIHLQPYYKKKYKFKRKDFINSEKFYENVLSLPLYPSLNFKDVKKVVKVLKKLI